MKLIVTQQSCMITLQVWNLLHCGSEMFLETVHLFRFGELPAPFLPILQFLLNILNILFLTSYILLDIVWFLETLRHFGPLRHKKKILSYGMRWSILCSAWPSKGPSGIRVRRLPHASHGLYSQTCFVHLLGFCGFQVRKTQTTIKTNTTAPSLLWSMTGGWSFTRAQEGRQKTTSPSGSSRCVGIIWILSHPSIHAYIPSPSSASCWHRYQKGMSVFTTTLFQLLWGNPVRYTISPSLIHVFFLSLQLCTFTKNSTSEGFPEIRWHQTADFGFVPNQRMKKTFMAVSLDLPDETSPYNP